MVTSFGQAATGKCAHHPVGPCLTRLPSVRVDDQLRVLEGRLESEILEKEKLRKEVGTLRVANEALASELASLKQQNARIVGQCNSTVTKVHFDEERRSAIEQELRRQVDDLSAKLQTLQRK